MGNFQEEKAPAKQEGKWGFIDTACKVVIPFVYDDVFPFHHQLSGVVKNNQYGFVNSKGQEICPIQYRNGTEIL